MIDPLYHLRSLGRIRLHAFVVMPDHFHFIASLSEGETVSRLMHSLKSYTANEINRRRGERCALWQQGSYSHGIRDERDLVARVKYVEANPVRAALASSIEEYELGSGCGRFPIDPW
ncbi:MAG: transposase [Dehalococcoidia bacterium]|nr:transposase [Dehalococcoidia bacterium]